MQNLREAVGFLEGGIRISPTKVDIAKIFEQDRDGEIDCAEVWISSATTMTPA